MSCDCQKFPPISFDRKSISTRIKESKALKKRLRVVAEDKQLSIALFDCPVCGEMWQSGREWNFANEEYLFRVPLISSEEWNREHYRQPAAMAMYSAVMSQHFERAIFTPSTQKCRKDGCDEWSSSVGVFCQRHQVESLQERGQLPKPPAGRLFPPYYEETA